MLPEDERLPMAGARGGEVAAGNQRNRGHSCRRPARPRDAGPRDGGSEVRPYDEGGDPAGEKVQLGLGRDRASKDAELSNLVEPQSAGEEVAGDVDQNER